LKRDIEATYSATVSGVLPLSEDVVMNASAGIFVALYPQHPWTKILEGITEDLIAPE
jgi:hypothetical protein